MGGMNLDVFISAKSEDNPHAQKVYEFLTSQGLACFFSKAGRALRCLPPGLRRTTLLGCMAGVAAQMVDAMANGSWRYTECSIFFWLVLGLGMAVTRMAYQTTGRGRQMAGEEPMANPLDLRTDRVLEPC